MKIFGRIKSLKTLPLTSERGFSMIEVLVAVALLSIAGLAVANSTIRSLIIGKRTVRHSLASELARSKIESLAAIDPSTLTSANNTTETNLVMNHVSFTRTTSVVVNADSSRSVTVSVIGNEESLGGTASFSSQFALWGNN